MPNKLVFSFEDGKVIVEDVTRPPKVVEGRQFHGETFRLYSDQEILWSRCSFDKCKFPDIEPRANLFSYCHFQECDFAPEGL